MTFNSSQQAYQTHSRNFQNYTFVYPVLSRRAKGISIGINLNLDKNCNFDCPYCQVIRTTKISPKTIHIPTIKTELLHILTYFHSTGICTLPQFEKISDNEKHLKDISLSGDGEPTMVPEFKKICQLIRDIQKQSTFSFSLRLITNSTLLHKNNTLQGLSYLMEERGEIWVKLDAGTQAWYQEVNNSLISLDQIEHNITICAQKYPLIIQTLFFEINHKSPSPIEILSYCNRIKNIQRETNNLQLIQLHSLSRIPSSTTAVGLSRSTLKHFAKIIEQETKIPTQVF